MTRPTMIDARAPLSGRYAEGFEGVARAFAAHLESGEELGGAFAAYHQGELVVDLWGGVADPATGRPWERDTSCVVFSVTKGLTAMAVHLLAQKGKLSLDAPVASLWPGFARGGKGDISVRTLLNHQGGLAALDAPLTMRDCLEPSRRDRLVDALERQRPLSRPGAAQAYHAITFGMYAREIIDRVWPESAGALLRRELFEPLGAEVWVGTPPEEDHRLAALVPPSTLTRVGNMLREAVRGGSTEARVARATLAPVSLPRRAFLNPSLGRDGVAQYNSPTVRRAELLWASATATARGLARAYQPFAQGGVVDGKRYLDASSIAPLCQRQGWSERDLVLQKPLGWTHGFLKEEEGVFSPQRASFGHAGMGGSLGWCDPVAGLSLGYVMNRMDWRVRSPRALALCRALYASPPLARS